jgi:hypothetical protein
MSLQDYHDVCEQHLRQWHQLWVASHVLVKLESIRHLSGSEYENSLEIACVGCRVYDEGWSRRDLSVECLWIPFVQFPLLFDVYLINDDKMAG